MFKSIQWTLQLWHAGLLAVVLVAFGTASYLGISRMRYAEVDSELERSAQALATGFRPPAPPGRPPDREAGRESPPGFHRRNHDRDDRHVQPPEGLGVPDWSGPKPGMRPETRPADGPSWGSWGKPPPPQIEVPPALAQRLGDDESGGLYYVVWGFYGEVIKSSRPTEDVPYPGVRPTTIFWPPSPELPGTRQRADLREAFVYGPFGSRVLVGKSVRHEQAQMRRLALLLIVAGAGVLVIGLAGGWLVSMRALRPIRTITTVAEDISASNLSRRIDTAGIKSELGQLAGVLNDTFARLEAAFQQQVRFTADASHELRTPLAVIHTNAQLALSRERSAEELRNMFETCLRASGRMKNLVDSLLLLAGADAGRLSLNCSLFDLRDIVEECVEMVAPLAAKKGLTVEMDLKSAELNADPSRVAQVATNLLTNAIRYTREGGRVTVSAEANGSDAVLTITDTGVGIPAENQPHLFERFYRVDKARSREEGGSGLGLAICKSIVEAHGGTIQFQSEAGKGTTFTVRLPLTTTKTSPGPAPL